MSTERVVPLIALRRHKKVSALVVAVATAGGLGLALAWPTNYTAETRLAVGGTNLAATAVPGFALAAQEMAANYARYVNNADEQPGLESALGVPDGTVQEVSASPIPASNVVRIEVVARDAGAATSAAAAVAESLIGQVNGSTDAEDEAAATLAEYTDISDQVSTAEQAADAAGKAVSQAAGQPGADLGSLREAAAQAAAQLEILKIQQQALGQKYRAQVEATSERAADLALVQPAVSTGSNLLPNLERFGLAGAVMGAGLALALSMNLERRRARDGIPARARASAGVSADGRLAERAASASVAVADDRVG
jgi:hypothetical protein